MSRDSFVLYTSINEVLRELTDEQKGQLFQAIVDYQVSGEMPDIQGMVRIAFIPIKQDLDANNEKWEKTRKARSDAGRRGMERRYQNEQTDNAVSDDVTNLTNDTFVSDDVTNLTVYEDVYVDVNGVSKDTHVIKGDGSKRNGGKMALGEYNNVKLTPDERDRLIAEYGPDDTESAIRFLDLYIEEKGKRYKSCYLAIRRWVMDAVREKREREKRYQPDGMAYSVAMFEGSVQ